MKKIRNENSAVFEDISVLICSNLSILFVFKNFKFNSNVNKFHTNRLLIFLFL
jgi:hypothetical protein